MEAALVGIVYELHQQTSQGSLQPAPHSSLHLHAAPFAAQPHLQLLYIFLSSLLFCFVLILWFYLTAPAIRTRRKSTVRYRSGRNKYHIKAHYLTSFQRFRQIELKNHTQNLVKLQFDGAD